MGIGVARWSADAWKPFFDALCDASFGIPLVRDRKACGIHHRFTQYVHPVKRES
jgi:hypothetical protein